MKSLVLRWVGGFDWRGFTYVVRNVLFTVVSRFDSAGRYWIISVARDQLLSFFSFSFFFFLGLLLLLPPLIAGSEEHSLPSPDRAGRGADEEKGTPDVGTCGMRVLLLPMTECH